MDTVVAPEETGDIDETGENLLSEDELRVYTDGLPEDDRTPTIQDSFVKLQGETKTAVLTSGAELSGSGLRILQYNSEQAEIEKNILDYNSKVAQSQKMEEANFARMRGQIARNEARAAQIGYYAKAGESLLKAYG